MNDKLSFAKLVDWIEGRLSLAEAAQVATLVAADAALQADVAWIKTFHQISDRTVWEAPPNDVRAALSRRFVAYAAENRPPTWWERLTAVLKFDSQTQPLAAGIRAAGSATDRQLIYSTPYADVALTFQQRPATKAFNILGHVLPTTTPAPDVYSVQLLQDRSERGFTATDEVGEFFFAELPGGEYELAIHNDQVEIIVPLQLSA